MRPLRDTDTDGFNHLIFFPDPISRFQYEKVHEAKKGWRGITLKEFLCHSVRRWI